MKILLSNMMVFKLSMNVLHSTEFYASITCTYLVTLHAFYYFTNKYEILFAFFVKALSYSIWQIFYLHSHFI